MTARHFPQSIKCAVIVIALLLISSCGGGSGDGSDDQDNSSQLIDVEVFEREIPVGGITRVALRFSYSANDVFGDGENVFLLLKIPSGLEFVDESAELDTIRGEDSVRAEINDCGNGISFVAIELDEDDLDEAANIEGNADAEVALKIRGTNLTDGAIRIEARADSSTVAFFCNRDFFAQASDSIEVR